MPRFYRFLQHPVGSKIFFGLLIVLAVGYTLAARNLLFNHAFAPAPTIVEQAVETSPNATLQYWTPARMQSATNDDLVTSNQPTTSQQSPATTQPGSQDAQQGQGVLPSKGSLQWLYPLTTVGKLFFVRGNSDYVCSGAAIVSENHNTVNTAGHCLYSEGVWSKDVLFCPLYSQGTGTYGCWAARDLAVPADWIDDSFPPYDFHHDMGMAVMAASQQGDLTDWVGGAGWAYNQEATQQFTAYGYPAAYPFDGESRHSCQGNGQLWEHGNGWAVSIDCNMTGGSSGGPWFIQNGEDSYINGHVDFGYRNKPGVLFSPLYDDTWYQLYNEAQMS
jgi:V8-like Glu-specific endopeptidase